MQEKVIISSLFVAVMILSTVLPALTQPLTPTHVRLLFDKSYVNLRDNIVTVTAGKYI